jgi:hypothetical protein
MPVTFLSPVGLLVAVGVVLPLLGLAALERRAARVRSALRLDAPNPRRRLELVTAFAAVAVLLGLAAAQPVLALSRDRPARSDAAVLFVIDVSRSMQAAQGRAGTTRLERAKAVATRVRTALGDVPAGVASITDRTLPYLFPSPNLSVFDATVEQSVALESPPPASGVGNPSGRASTLGALAAVATKNYFQPGQTHRVLIVLTDAESAPFAEAGVGAVFRKPPRVRTIFVRFWRANERIWVDGHIDPFYRPDFRSERTATTLALATRGRAYDERDVGAIVRTAKFDLGTGKVSKQRLERSRTPIGAWVAAAALLPLGFVLRRRNF